MERGPSCPHVFKFMRTGRSALLLKGADLASARRIEKERHAIAHHHLEESSVAPSDEFQLHFNDFFVAALLCFRDDLLKGPVFPPELKRLQVTQLFGFCL